MQRVWVVNQASILAIPYLCTCILIICTLFLSHAPLVPSGTPIHLEPSFQHIFSILFSCPLLYFIAVAYMDGFVYWLPGKLPVAQSLKTSLQQQLSKVGSWFSKVVVLSNMTDHAPLG